MKSWLKPGVKVVCIKRGKWDHEGIDLGITRPVFGGVYTIRTVGPGSDGGIYLRFEEIHNPVRKYSTGLYEKRFAACRFRPLTKRSTDTEVSKLKRLLNTTPADLEKVDG